MNDNLLTIKEAADYLDVHWQTIRSYIAKGKIKANKVGRSYRIKENELKNLLENKSEEEKEYEIRYLLNDRGAFEEKLRQKGAKLKGYSHMVDYWFVPKFIKSKEQKEEFFESAKGYVLRIRETEDSYSGKVNFRLEVKKLVKPYKYEACLEGSIEVKDYENTKKFLRLANHKQIVKIDKTRTIYILNDIKVSIDEITDYKTAVELEKVSSDDAEKVVSMLQFTAKNLGLRKKANITDKSIVHQAMSELAKY
jgi:predicted adenylyl cyclase CyaB